MPHEEGPGSTDIRANPGARIRLPREGQGLSRGRFAAMIGMGHSYLVSVEKGRCNVSVDNLSKISRGLGVPLSELFREVDSFAYASVRQP